MSPTLKAISNPYSSGGGGHNFENYVQTAFAVLMLAGGFLPCLPGNKVTKLKLQCKNVGFSTDDIVAYTKNANTNAEHKLLCQVKHSISVTNSDKQFQEVITCAWEDFNNSSIFKKGKDIIALITGPLSKTDVYDTRIILEWARYSENENDFFENKINLSNLSSDQKRYKVKVFRDTLQIANRNQPVPDDIVFSFLKHFHIIGYDLDTSVGVTHSLLNSIINQFESKDFSNFIWSRISDEVRSYNQNAGTITCESFPNDIKLHFKGKIARKIPMKYVRPSKNSEGIITSIDNQNRTSLFVAAILGAWNENSQGDKDIIGEVAIGF